MDWGDDTDDATPLTDGQRKGLKLAWITTRAELNDVEADNVISGAEKWHRRSRTLGQLLDDKAVRDLHRDMFGDVWRWAGSYRTEDLNIGVEFWRVSTAVRDLVDDAAFWFAEGSSMTADLAGVRFHHRLVQVHPFPNGNGRHSRQLTDLILLAVGAEPFTWGSNALGPLSETRRDYVRALQAADRRAYDDLCTSSAPTWSWIRSQDHLPHCVARLVSRPRRLRPRSASPARAGRRRRRFAPPAGHPDAP